MFLNLLYVFLKNQDVNIENLGVHGLPRNISEMSAGQMSKSPK